MRKRVPLLVALALLAVTVSAPVAAATHSSGVRKRPYVAASPAASVADGPLPVCNVLSSGYGLGGVCFDWGDAAHQVDIVVHDEGRDEAEDAYRQASPVDVPSPLSSVEPDDESISGTIRYIDGDRVVRTDSFCTRAHDRYVPDHVDTVEVVLDGPEAAAVGCGSGAVFGTVSLYVDW